MVMAPGMMFTIEPMVNMGKVNVVTDEKNGWRSIYSVMDFLQHSGKFRFL